jgi:hypothetical protein
LVLIFFNECASARGADTRHYFCGYHQTCLGMGITKFRLGLPAKGLLPNHESGSEDAIAAQAAEDHGSAVLEQRFDTVAQLVLLDLAGGCLGQLAKDDLLGALEPGQTGAGMATVSPLPTPRIARAEASRLQRSATSPQLRLMHPCICAGNSGCTRSTRLRIETGDRAV